MKKMRLMFCSLSVAFWFCQHAIGAVAIDYVEPIYVGGVATNGIAYWVTNTAPSCIVVESSDSPMIWNAGWYAVLGENVTISGGVTCNGPVHLVLYDGAKLTVKGVGDGLAGISVSPQDNASLTIYGQRDGSGILEVTGGGGGAGIGGGRERAGAHITINGGIVLTTGSDDGAGIGGGYQRAGWDITINGGSVTSYGFHGAGIGGGNGHGGHNITINGGLIAASTSGAGAGIGGGSGGFGEMIIIRDGSLLIETGWGNGPSGIGGGYKADGRDIAIHGGAVNVVVASGGGACIGGGSVGCGENITITGGDVTVTGSMSGTYEHAGAGIGGGYRAGGSNIVVCGGVVKATSGKGGAGIGGGAEGGGCNIRVDGGKITAVGTSSGAGIGGGRFGEGSNIVITDGVVIANGGSSASSGGAGIGGGNKCKGSDIRINGGNVTANGGYKAMGIGGGNAGECSSVFVATTMCLKSDNDDPPMTVIENDGSDLSAKIAGNRHATVEVRPECVITVNAAEHGVVKASAALAEAGETIALAVMPDEGCELVSLVVQKADDPSVKVNVQKVSEDIYSFVMPKYGVSVSPTFRISPPPKPEGGPYKETVDGVEWTFMVDANLNASVGTGEYGGWAIPQLTTGAITIPAKLGGRTVASIGDWAFCDCRNLATVTIPSTVTNIGVQAFCICSSLTDITIPSSVRSIGGSAFVGCGALVSVTIREGVTSIGESAFSGSGVTSVTIPSTVKSWDSAFRWCQNLRSSTIAEGVRTIPSDAFANSGLQNLTIPSSVTNINASAFFWCLDLQSLDVAADNTVYSSIDGVLFNKSKNTLIEYPQGRSGAYEIPSSVTSIDKYAFEDCRNLTDVTIPLGVTNMGFGAFSYCTNLTSVTIPSSVMSWPGAFDCCSGLQDVTIQNGVANIGYATFRECAGLKSVAIPSSVTSIGESAFQACIGLTDVTIPSGVTSIGDRAFYYCTNLNVVDFEGAPPEGVGDAYIKQDAAIRYNVAYEAQWLPVIEECGWTNATPYVPLFVPVFSPADGTVFKGSCTVTLTCPTPGASIYYRIGAKPKATSKYLYSVPFEITETSTVYAFAKLGDTESDCVTATYTKGKVITFEEAVKAKGITAFTHGGDAVWCVEEGLGEGDVCVRSGVIIDEQVSWFETTVQGPGTISFKWKASCEEDYPSHEWDHLAFNIDGAKDDYARLDGVTDWEDVSAKLEAGTHTLRWSYVKDESDAEGEDCGWVDCVSWVADAPAPVPPGGEIDVPEGKTAKEFADEVNKNKAQYLNWPLEGPVSTDYLGYFTAVPKGDAKVAFVLSEEGTNEVVKATTAAKTSTLESVLSKTGTLVIGDPLIGFYYSLKQGSDVTVGDKADLNKLAGRDELSFPLTTDKSKYFYQSLVTPTPVPTK